MSLESVQSQSVDTKMEQKSGGTAESLSISRQRFFVLKDQGIPIQKLMKDISLKKETGNLVSPKLVEIALKYGAEFSISNNPLAAAIGITEKAIIGKCLSKFSASQCAGIVGLFVSSISPQATVPLLLKKISDDLDYLRESLDIVRETPQYMANEFLCTALQAVNEYNIQKALYNFKRAEYEATRGVHMSPSFHGSLICTQVKIFSKVMIECASELDGISCFVPIHCLPQMGKKKVESTIKDGLITITKKAKTKKWNGKTEISSKMQDIIDPFLAALYNIFSISSGHTNPYHDHEESAPQSIHFNVDITYVPEGENDSCSLEVLLHPDEALVFFIWKEIGKNKSYLHLRNKKVTWKLDISNGSLFTLIYDRSATDITYNGVSVERTVGWPMERKTSKELIHEARLKMKSKVRRKSYETYDWIKKVSNQYLASMEIKLDIPNNDGNYLLHVLTAINDRKALKCVLEKIRNVDVVNASGETPLHIACSKAFFKAAKILIQKGADVNAITKEGESPLTLLVANKAYNIELLKLLLDRDVKKNYENKDNMRAVDIAKEKKAGKKIITLLQPHIYSS